MALRFALEEAKLRQATLRAVHGWYVDYLGAPGIEATSPALGAELLLGSMSHSAPTTPFARVRPRPGAG